MGAQERLVLNNVAMGRVGDLLITCIGKGQLSDSEVAQMLERFELKDFRALLFCAKGEGPNSKQRARIAEYWKTRGSLPRTVLLSDSKTARFVGQAISWLLNMDIKFCGESEVDQAIAYLGGSASVAEVSGAIVGLHAAIEFKQRRVG